MGGEAPCRLGGRHALLVLWVEVEGEGEAEARSPTPDRLGMAERVEVAAGVAGAVPGPGAAGLRMAACSPAGR